MISLFSPKIKAIALELIRQFTGAFDETIFWDHLALERQRHIQEKINAALDALLSKTGGELSAAERQKIIQYVIDELFALGPISPLVRDPEITEIMVNGCRQVFVERNGRIEKTDISFRDDDHVQYLIDKILKPLGRRVDWGSPMADARLPDGSRVNVIIPPLAIKGPALTIRKFSRKPFTAEDLISFGTLSREMAAFLKSCVRARVNMLVSGGTGSGKTSTLNVLSSFIPSRERIVTIEDAAELHLQQEHVVTLESRPPDLEGRGEITIRQLVINALRMRPDRIVVGEVRGKEALDMLQAMNTGHDGSISTLHANNPRDALSRLETMVLMSGLDLPLVAVRKQIASAVDLIIHQSRFSDGSRKIVNITEVVGMEGDTITMQDIFVFNQTGFNEKGHVIGHHLSTGIVPKCLEKLKAHGESIPTDIFEVRTKSIKAERSFWRA